ncbi:protein phosphatase 2C domain-containing protein [Alsobacter sp. SYSU M60028]|uniref:Protein phosphatase 2C domain-containing protein n=1 Tax=Alsobacter ponti TaxID=2962936 RepID=A0ABT1L6U1_9HYPH|nr:protein phosphatase 2C domain-containing protein [Alsobacter ponti]MCP8937110.1 protein phosphatase 2C domain-containing protein [Alsobacter ponti]
MLLEAFTQAKDPRAPQANEDRFVVLPGRAYAVIDGATARTGARYDGMLSGQYAAATVEAALERILSAPGAPLDDGMAVVRALTRALREGYERHGMAERARHERHNRFSATLALVTLHDGVADVTLVGDSGVRLGGRVVQVEKDLDLITSTLRQQAWPIIGEVTQDPDLREKLSRQIAWHGTSQVPELGLAPHLDTAHLARIEERALAANAERLPHAPRADIEKLVRGGIVNAQGDYQNESDEALGYSCLDGFDVPERLVHREQVALDGVDAIELFTDGYFAPGEGFGVAAWEDAFRRVEREDREKVRLHLSPKGSTRQAFADDRTYLGVRF